MSQIMRVGNSSVGKKLLKSTCSRLSAFAYSSTPNDYEVKSKESVESRTVEFSRNRSRDISGETMDLRNDEDDVHLHMSSVDDHVEMYDSHGTISLSSAMQSTVPEPYSTHGKKAPTHLNMPGGHWGQNQKYLSDNLQKTHHNVNTYTDKGTIGFTRHPQPALNKLSVLLTRHHSTCPMILSTKVPVIFSKVSFSTQQPQPEKSLTVKDKLKIAVMDYGPTVIVFHVTISLISLGGFYLAVSSGLDVATFIKTIGLAGSQLSENSFEVGASNFVVSYAIYKIFAPLRIAVTLTVSPIIVKYLRNRGILKKK